MAASEQLTLLDPEPAALPRKTTGGHLAEPLSPEERRRFGRFYAENVRLVRKFAHKLRGLYGGCMEPEDINHCCDLAFLKACRAWQPDRGAFSTVFWTFAQGEARHWIRDRNWSVAAPGRVRDLGMRARRLAEAGLSPEQVRRELHCSADDLRLALVATSPVGHDRHGFDLHACPRATPWEALEAAT